MKHLPIAIVLAFLALLFFTGCSDEDFARTERVLNGAVSGYYNRPAYYPPAPVVVAPVAPYTY